MRPGWLAIYGTADEVRRRQDGDKGQNLVPVKPGESGQHQAVDPRGLKDQTARALLRNHIARRHGKRRQTDRRRRAAQAMQEKGLGTPATRGHHRRPADRKYMLREAARSSPRPRPSSS